MFETDSIKSRSQIWGLMTNKLALSCFGVLLIQQLLDASAIIWLVTATKRIANGESFILYVVLYLLSWVVPYIPGCIANVIKISWKQEAQRSFIKAFVSANRNCIGEWTNKGLKEQKLSMLTAEGPTALNALIDYIFDLAGYVMNVALNICALSLVVEPLFAIAYGVSIVVVLFVMALRRRTQRKLTQKALTARVDLCQSLRAAWDNVLLGNQYNFKLWEDRTTQRLNRCLQKNVDLERFDQVLAIGVCLLTSIPSLIVVVHYVYTHQNNVADLTSFLVTLPMLFLIVSYTYQLLNLVFRWGMHMSKLDSIYKTIQAGRDSESPQEKKIKWAKLNLTQSTIAPIDHISLPGPQMPIFGPQPIDSAEDVIKESTKPGRLTIRGENGSGKSTLLMMIKKALAHKAFFLPTQNQLSFTSEANKHSTGESLRNRLVEILEKVDAEVLLLDEWDANLDNENKERLTELIDALAEKKCVIEVRHR